MPKLRRCSGLELMAKLQRHGFVVEHQRGSHVKLVRMFQTARQVLIIPNHKILDTGTMRAIARQAGKYLTAVELDDIFYSE